ncbi:alkaline phosphatase family protein [Nocardioides astragali]|uniref:Alkaline phosphatase family protein n=1 Tax=Nocardioides astragali TaxID=1776736 RepID=A0ABW2N887_9ACTN|nr:alkaline phosphatase family protein [Nocardioides astragali]
MERVKHIVVLMLENRSFDHMLGHLAHNGLDPIAESHQNELVVRGHQLPPFKSHALKGGADITVDPAHSHREVTRQLTGKVGDLVHDQIDMSGFVQSYYKGMKSTYDRLNVPLYIDDVAEIMGYQTANTVPVLSRMAKQFTTCTRWFSSVPGETFPNRLFAHGAQSAGRVSRLRGRQGLQYEHSTTFSTLSKHRIPWAVYAGDVPQAAVYADLNDAFKNRFNRLSEFFDDVRQNRLPAYSFLEPRHFVGCDSQHPPHGVGPGEQLLARVYTALVSNRRVWESVLFLVVWDEHGGFFDREKPPLTTPPIPGQQAADATFGFDILGVRVPAVVVSPFVEAGSVSPTVFDHSCIVRTVFDAFDIPGHLTERDKHAASLLPLLTRESPRDPPSPARRSLVVQGDADTIDGTPPVVVLDDFQQSLIELAHSYDERRSAAPTRALAAPGMAPGIALERLVGNFQRDHLGSAARRREEDELWVASR